MRWQIDDGEHVWPVWMLKKGGGVEQKEGE